MRSSKSQLCDRARQLASARLDGRLSELEGALLDAHLSRCGSCSSFAADVSDIAGVLRAAALQQPERPPVVVAVPRHGARRLRLLQTAAAIALVLVAAAIGSALNITNHSTASSRASAQRHTAMLAFADTPDQLRRLRRQALIQSGEWIPRNRAFVGESV